jgi:hypothetical protein
MAISKEKTAECLGRLQLLKWFPLGGHALAELGRILNEICRDDAEASGVVSLILQKHDEWPGPCSIRQAQTEVQRARVAAEHEQKRQADLAGWKAERTQHEADCPGYTVSISEENKTLDVGTCNQHWGDYHQSIHCRRSESIPDAGEFCRRLQAEELAKRPGWEAYWQKVEREFASRRAVPVRNGQ